MKMVLDFSEFIAGWIGGICGLCVGHPLDTVKVRQQAYGSSFITALGRTYRHEGIPGFFKGLMFPLMTVGPTSALLFGIYGNVLHHLQPSGRDTLSYQDAEVLRHIYIAGTVGGIVQTVALCPVELIKTILQARTGGTGSWRKHYEVSYTGSVDAFRGIVRDRGFFGLFRGLTPLLMRDVPTSGLYILTYEWLMYHHLNRYDMPLVVQRSLAGGSAGVMSWLFVFPLDVVKSRIQTDSPKNPQYRGIVDCFVKSYKADGFRVFFKGVPVTLMRTFPTNAATFVGYEMALEYLQAVSRKRQ